MSESSLKKRMLRAVGWSVIGHGLGQIIRLFGSLVMTRLLVPEMFGVMAIATMVTMILGMLSDIGLRQNIVQSQRGDDPVFLDTAWVVQILRGFGMWLISVLLCVGLYSANTAGFLPAGSVYASPELPIVVIVSALSAVILGFQSTKMATADRKFDQKRLVKIDLVSQVAALGVMIFVGTATHSIWALVAGNLVSALLSTVLSHIWMIGHSNQFRFEKSALREIVGFGKWVFVSSTMTVLASTGDRLLLGWLVSAEILGMYAIAALIARTIENALHKLFQTVSLPAFSEIHRADPARLRDVYYKLRIPADLILLFVAGMLFSSGQLFIGLLYDPRYSSAGNMLEVLALSLVTARYGFSHQIYLAVGVTKYLALINSVRFISLYAIVPFLFYWHGTAGAIWGIALHGATTIPLIYLFNSRLGLNDIRRELMVLPAIVLGLICGAGLTRLVVF